MCLGLFFCWLTVSVYLSDCLTLLLLSLQHYICLSTYIYVCQSVNPSVCLSVNQYLFIYVLLLTCLSVDLSTCLFFYLRICLVVLFSLSVNLPSFISVSLSVVYLPISESGFFLHKHTFIRPFIPEERPEPIVKDVSHTNRDLKGHGNKANFLGVLHNPVPCESLTLTFEPFQFWLRIRRDIRNQKTTKRLTESGSRKDFLELRFFQTFKQINSDSTYIPGFFFAKFVRSKFCKNR